MLGPHIPMIWKELGIDDMEDGWSGWIGEMDAMNERVRGGGYG